MIKKSQVLAILEGCPDEFEPGLLRDIADQFEAPELTEAQKEAVHNAVERARTEGKSSPVEEVEARFAAWAES